MRTDAFASCLVVWRRRFPKPWIRGGLALIARTTTLTDAEPDMVDDAAHEAVNSARNGEDLRGSSGRRVRGARSVERGPHRTRGDA